MTARMIRPAVLSKLRGWLKIISAEPATVTYIEKQGVQLWAEDGPMVREHQAREIAWWNATAKRAGLARIFHRPSQKQVGTALCLPVNRGVEA